MWTQPRAAFRRVLEAHTRDLSWLILAVGTYAASTFVRAESGVGARLPGIVSVGLAVASGLVFGPLLVSLIAGALYLTGRMNGGPATFREMRAVYAWSSLPHALLVVGWLPATLILGRSLYGVTAGVAPTGVGGILVVLLFLALTLASLVGLVWSFVLLVIGVSAAERTTTAFTVFHIVWTFITLGVVFVVAVMIVFAIIGRLR